MALPAPTKVANFDVSTIVRDNNGTLVVADRSQIPATVMTEINSIMNTINFSDSNTLSNYGTDSQKGISAIASTVLNSVKTKDSGEVGVLLGGLVKNIKGLDGASLSQESGLKGLLGKIIDPIKTFQTKQRSVEANMDVIIKDLTGNTGVLVKNNGMLDKVYIEVGTSFQKLQISIAAGYIKLEQERTTTLAELEATATETQDAMDIQKFQDYKNILDSFEKRLYDMMIARSLAMMQGPSIRMLQSNNTALIKQINDVINTAVPAWKTSIAMALAANDQLKIAKSTEMVTDCINQSIQASSKLMGNAAVAVATQRQKSVITAETVIALNDGLINTIESVRQIEADGAVKRAAELKQIADAESKLKAVLLKK